MSLSKAFKEVISKWPKDAVRIGEKDLRSALENRISITYDAIQLNNSISQEEIDYIRNTFTSSQTLNSLQNILNDVYKTRYSISERVLNPAMNPKHYEAVLSNAEKTARTVQNAKGSKFISKILGQSENN